MPLKFKASIPVAASILSGVFLALAFPPFDQPGAAWVSLVPLLLTIRNAAPRQAFQRGLLAGTVFYLISMHWLLNLARESNIPTAIGAWTALSLYCGLYTGFYAYGLQSVWVSRRARTFRGNMVVMSASAFLWAGLESIRSTWLTGFPWNAMGVSQYTKTVIIQIADIGGVALISALIVFVNTAAALTVARYIDLRGRWRQQMHPEMMVALVAVMASVAYGWKSVERSKAPTESVRLALVQPNIPQGEKWTREKIGKIHDRLAKLTQVAVRMPGIDMIIWPETSLPERMRVDRDSYELVYSLVTNGVPMLVGSMDVRWPDDGHVEYFNSAMLIDEQGKLVDVYDKQHLVLFGEYVPLESVIPFIGALTPIEGNFTPGTESVVFEVPHRNVTFSTLICFEDILFRLASKAVSEGARFLVNQTNDGWFDPSSASRQHLSHCVFRCIENRVPAIRVTNTGISCGIDLIGQITAILSDEDGNTRISGVRSVDLNVPLEIHPTFFRLYGYWLTHLLSAATVVFLVISRLRKSQPSDDAFSAE